MEDTNCKNQLTLLKSLECELNLLEQNWSLLETGIKGLEKHSEQLGTELEQLKKQLQTLTLQIKRLKTHIADLRALVNASVEMYQTSQAQLEVAVKDSQELGNTLGDLNRSLRTVRASNWPWWISAITAVGGFLFGVFTF